jgi:hypothetical protein
VADDPRWHFRREQQFGGPQILEVAPMDGGLEVRVYDDDAQWVEIWLPRDAALDLVDHLESWRAGWFREDAAGS